MVVVVTQLKKLNALRKRLNGGNKKRRCGEG